MGLIDRWRGHGSGDVRLGEKDPELGSGVWLFMSHRVMLMIRCVCSIEVSVRMKRIGRSAGAVLHVE